MRYGCVTLRPLSFGTLQHCPVIATVGSKILKNPKWCQGDPANRVTPGVFSQLLTGHNSHVQLTRERGPAVSYVWRRRNEAKPVTLVALDTNNRETCLSLDTENRETCVTLYTNNLGTRVALDTDNRETSVNLDTNKRELCVALDTNNRETCVSLDVIKRETCVALDTNKCETRVGA